MKRTLMIPSVGLLLAASISIGHVQAQGASATAASALESAAWRVPVHTQPDDPDFGPYGHWAAGRGYKVSFHDGMAFYPRLGESAPRNLPVRWTTTSVRRGGAELVGGGEPEHGHDSWSYEYRFAGVTERYEVRAEGIEQSFVIHRPLGAAGDLVVTGRWESELGAVRDARPGSDVAAVRFVDDRGRDVVRYGEALAFDASGRRIDVATRLNGDEIELVVPAGWVRDAAWPITIDPLLTAQSLAFLGATSQAIVHSDVGVAMTTDTHRVMTVFTLPTSSSDTDMHVLLTDENFQDPRVVFSDVTTSWESNHPSVGYVDSAGATGKWVVAFARTNTASQIRVLRHDGGDTTPGSGSLVFLPVTVPNWADKVPDVGGSRNSNNALVVYESDNPNSGSELYRVMVDADAGTFGPASLLAPTPIGSAIPNRGNPSVSTVADGSPLGWMTCYQEYPIVPRKWEIQARRVFDDGSASGAFRVAPEVHTGGNREYLEPEVDGGNTRYGVSYLVGDQLTLAPPDEVEVTRFMWAPADPAPTISWSSTIDSTVLTGGFFDPRLTYDPSSGHWAVAYLERSLLTFQNSVQARRVGFDGAVVEVQSVYSNASNDGAAPAICYDLREKRFLVTYGTEGTRSPVFGRPWTYPADALNIPYGSSCGGAFGNLSDPLLGTEFFRIRLTGAAPLTAAVLLVGGGMANLPLDPIGMPSCAFLVDPTVVISLPAVTDTAGDALVTIVGLTVAGDLYTQWMHIAPGANQLGLLATEGMLSQIR